MCAGTGDRSSIARVLAFESCQQRGALDVRLSGVRVRVCSGCVSVCTRDFVFVCVCVCGSAGALSARMANDAPFLYGSFG